MFFILNYNKNLSLKKTTKTTVIPNTRYTYTPVNPKQDHTMYIVHGRMKTLGITCIQEFIYWIRKDKKLAVITAAATLTCLND
jgi:hypothetical protein